MAEDKLESITIRVPTEVVEHILVMMQPELGEMDRDEILSDFTSLGFQHFYDWLSGRKRYRTLTEQHTEWLENIYTGLLPEDEAPGYSRLYNRFNIPYGQAGYMMRVLVEKDLPHLRATARQELEEALRRALPTAQQAIEEGVPDQTIKVTVSLLADRELRILVNLLYRKDEGTLLPERSSTYGDQKTVMLPAKTLGELLEELER